MPPDDDDGKGKFRTAAGGKVASRLDDERRTAAANREITSTANRL